MAKQTINIGSSPNDGNGSTIRAGGDIVNDNFTELYNKLGCCLELWRFLLINLVEIFLGLFSK